MVRSGTYLALLFLSCLWTTELLSSSRTLKDLPDMSVNAFAQDSTGYMWIATENGLCRYNGYNYVQYYNEPTEDSSIPSSRVLSLKTDGNGVLWAATDKGLCYYDLASDSFVRIKTDLLLSGLEYASGKIFYYGEDGILGFDITTKQVVDEETTPVHNVSFLKACSDGSLLGGLSDGQHLVRLDMSLNHLATVTTGSYSKFLCASEDLNDKVWVGSENGLLILESSSLSPAEDSVSASIVKTIGLGKVAVILHNGERVFTCVQGKGIMSFDTSGQLEKSAVSMARLFSLNYTSDFTCGIIDMDGLPWIGTSDRGFGIRYYWKNNFKIDEYVVSLLKGKYVNAISTDGKTVWFGSYYKGLLGLDVDTRLKGWERYDDKIFKPVCNGNLGIISLLKVSKDRLWIGMSGKIVCCGTDRQLLKSAKVEFEGITAHSFAEMSSGDVWAGTDAGLLCCSGKNAGKMLFKNHGIPVLEPIGENKLIVSVEDQGPFYVDTQSFEMIMVPLPESCISELKRLNCILADSKGGIWFGTRFDGILHARKNADGESFSSVEAITMNEGLGSNEISGIIEDGDGNIWVSASIGISLISDKYDRPITYYPNQWLDIQQFCSRSIASFSSFIVAGGNIGIALFNPGTFVQNISREPVHISLSGLKVNGETQRARQPGGVLNNPIGKTSSIVLRHNQNSIDIEYEAISFLQGNNVNFAYRLTGRGGSDDWNEVGSYKIANFSNLPSGHYVFELIAQNLNGFWNDAPLTLNILVKKSPWLSWYSMLLYLVVLGGVTVCVSCFIVRIKTREIEVKAVKDELEREKKLSTMKVNFFTNVSHELRNSLSLVYGPVNMLLATTDKLKSKTLVEAIDINTKRLLMLTGQMLDLSRIENETLPLTVTYARLMPVVRNVIRSYDSLAIKKNINVSLVSSFSETDKVILDVNKFSVILSNLLSNALKYTPEGGNVQVRLSLENHLPEKLKGAKESSEYLVLIVNDDGIGMQEEETEQIFKRYKRLEDASRSVYGTGIGLHYVQQLLIVHGGAVSAAVRQEGGMSFSVAIPTDKSLYEVVLDSDEVTFTVDGLSAVYDDGNERSEPAPSDYDADPNRPKVVFVEDNLQLLKYCSETFAGKYDIHPASNGQEGYDLVNDEMPDIVVTDIVMPGMDGYELCAKIKNDPMLSHIAVVILTAKTDEENKLAGYKAGADIYVTKPFNALLLMTMMDNIIASRNKMREHFVSLDSGNIDSEDFRFDKLNSADKAFIDKLRQFIDDNIAETDISINVLSNEMCLSRSSFFRKMKSLTGMTPNDFILAYRLNKATVMLKEGSCRINEISDLLGFSTPSHFSKVFKQRFGKSPKDYSLS